MKLNFTFKMIKQLLILFVLASSIPKCYSNIRCTRGVDFYCGENQTCCRSITGWNCVDIFKGKCCTDGMTACEAGLYCDLKTNTCVKRVEAKKLKLLTDDPSA